MDAQATEIIVHAISYHADRAADYNERNFGIGLRVPVSDRTKLAVGAYNNSLYRDSYYIGMSREMLRFSNVTVSIMAGIITGYQHTIMPVVAPEVTLWSGNVGVSIMALPSVAGLSLKYRW